MEYVFEGIVECGDSSRTSDGLCGAIFIGGKDVIGEIDFKDGTKVTCGVMDENFDGELFMETGWGYSEWTPMDRDTLKVGTHDMIDILSRYEGKEITFVISDEPINILEVK